MLEKGDLIDITLNTSLSDSKTIHHGFVTLCLCVFVSG